MSFGAYQLANAARAPLRLDVKAPSPTSRRSGRKRGGARPRRGFRRASIESVCVCGRRHSRVDKDALCRAKESRARVELGARSLSERSVPTREKGAGRSKRAHSRPHTLFLDARAREPRVCLFVCFLARARARREGRGSAVTPRTWSSSTRTTAEHRARS